MEEAGDRDKLDAARGISPTYALFHDISVYDYPRDNFAL